jgi:hypothetical protein
VLVVVIMMADLQAFTIATIKITPAGFVVMSSCKMKTMGEDQVDR